MVSEALAHADAVWVIDDGSTDGTDEALAGLDIRLVRHEANLGKGERLAEGLAAAFAEGVWGVVTIDGDGQHDPGDIPAFRAAALAQPGALISGERERSSAMPRHRAASIAFGNVFIGWACGWRIRDAQCGMRLYPAAFGAHVRVPERLATGFVFETAALMYAAEAGLTLATVPIETRYAGFQHRPSHFRPVADFLAIFAAVARFLVERGLRPSGLLPSLGLTLRD